MTIDLNDLRQTGGIIKLQGREFITFSGLLVTAHSNGLKSITPTLISYDAQARAAVFSATVEGERGCYTAHGDADESNVKRGMQGAILRMAETRAICRALRCYLGIGMTAREELPGDAKPERQAKPERGELWSHDERAAFMDAIAAVGVTPPMVSQYTSERGWSLPYSWTADAREAFLADLASGKIPALYSPSAD